MEFWAIKKILNPLRLFSSTGICASSIVVVRRSRAMSASTAGEDPQRSLIPLSCFLGDIYSSMATQSSVVSTRSKSHCTCPQYYPHIVWQGHSHSMRTKTNGACPILTMEKRILSVTTSTSTRNPMHKPGQTTHQCCIHPSKISDLISNLALN